ncbi:MAG: permease-like cell division protein FtsX [Ruminococcus sp.]|nr:permease-like cell division protein FtsX [Ruminococcus sp.]
MKGFGYLTKEGFKNVWSNRIMSIASICVLVCCLILTGAAALLSINVEKVVDSVGKSNETTIYLSDNVSELEAVFIGKDLEKIDNVTSITFYSKEEAFESFREELGDELFAQIEENNNPLPDSYIVAMDDLSAYDKTVEEITAIDGVDSVSNRSEIAKKLTDISHLVNLTCFWVVTALAIISLFIIANTIRATMYSRRFEISIMKSVGATDSFVRMPFLVEGMVIGIISAFVATGGITVFYNTAMAAIEKFIPLNPIPFSHLFFPVFLSFIVAGAVIGIIGSFISIRKYLRKEGNEILGW